jgi:hypothetical protein
MLWIHQLMKFFLSLLKKVAAFIINNCFCFNFKHKEIRKYVKPSKINNQDRIGFSDILNLFFESILLCMQQHFLLLF